MARLLDAGIPGTIGVFSALGVTWWSQKRMAARTRRDALRALVEKIAWEYVSLMVEYWSNPPKDSGERQAKEGKGEAHKHYLLRLLAKYPKKKKARNTIDRAVAELLAESEGGTYQGSDHVAYPPRAAKVGRLGAKLLAEVQNAE